MLCRRAAPLFAVANHLQSHPTPCAACIALRLLHRSPTHLLHSRPALRKARTSHTGESAAADLPPYPCRLLRAPVSPVVTPGGLRTSRTPPTAKPHAEPSLGAANLANSGAAPPWELCSGDSAPPPAPTSTQSRPIRGQRIRFDQDPIFSEPSDPDQIAQITTYPFGLAFFLKSP